MKPRSARFAAAAALLLVCTAAAGALDDYRPRVSVIPMKNETGDSEYDVVCRTVTDTVALGLRLLGSYRVVESDEDPALENADVSTLSAIAAHAAAARYDEVLFGTATRDDEGTLTFRLSLFNTKDSAIKHEVASRASSILDVFDAADEITIGLLSKLSTIHIGFGSIDVKNLSAQGTYTIFLNGNRIRNPRSELRKILNGRYTVSVHQQRLLGDTVIYERPIDVFEDETASVAFTIPEATERETAYLEERARKLAAAGAEGGSIDGLLREIASFQELARTSQFDARLRAIQERALMQAGAEAKAALSDATKKVDAAYYSKSPDFRELRERYGSLARLVSDAFDFRLLECADAPPLAQPRDVVWRPDGALYVLDSAHGATLRVSDDARAVRCTVELGGADGAQGRIAVDAASNVYFSNGSADGTILVFDSALAALPSITVPDFAPEPGSAMPIAASDEGYLYLAAPSRFYVFEPGKGREREIEAAVERALRDADALPVTSLFFDAEGLLNVFAASRGSLVRFDPYGVRQSVVRLPTAERDSRIAVDARGCIYVSAPSENRVLKYDSAGALITAYGRYGVGEGEFSYPVGVSAASDGSLCIADSYNNRVQLLSLTSPPVLLPDVAQLGVQLDKREQTAMRAEQRLGFVRENARVSKSAGPLAGSLGLVVAAGGAALAAGYLESVAIRSYADYQLATDPHRVYDLRNQTTESWMLGQAADLGVAATVLGAAALLAAGMVSGVDAVVAQSVATSEMQSLSLDADYEFAPEQYRSLSGVERVGLWTGIVPPVACGAALIASTMIPALSPYASITMPVLLAGAVVVPPIWSHLSAGTLHYGLLASGFAADAAAAAAIFVSESRAAGWAPGELALFQDNVALYPMLNNAWKQLQTSLPLYLGAAAVGIRIAAGIYDHDRGWLAAKDHNLYRAVRAKAPSAPPELSVRFVPTPRMDGVALALSMRY